MKLRELYLKNYKGFVDFSINFDSETSITAVIGQNGVGKSNLIEAIVSIFRALDLKERTDFDYRLSYECRGHEIVAEQNSNLSPSTLVLINGDKKSSEFIKKNAKEYLPLNVFTYYSGTNWRVEELFVKHQTHFYKKLTEGDDQLIRRFFYCRDVHSFFVLLAFLMDEDSACKNILEKLDITGLESVLFCLKKPYWYKGKPSEVMLEQGDPRFWYSRGVVRDFLSDLWEHAIAPIYNRERKVIDFRGRSENQDRLYLFLQNESSLRELASKYADTTSLFKYIESTYIADILENVEVSVRLKNGGELTFDELSEGERQLLTVLGLMKFTRDDESLFLLDEPDTHLNPRWKLDYFDQIEKILDHRIMGSDKTSFNSSQIILTTHDPLMLTSLYASQVRVLTESKEEGKRSQIPDEDPIHMGVEAIIQSGLYGIRTSLDKDIQHKIDLRNRLLSMEELTPKQLFRLNELNRELDEIGLSQAHPNPYFSNFAKAIARNPAFRRQEFTGEEYKELQELSNELLNEIIEEEKGAES